MNAWLQRNGIACWVVRNILHVRKEQQDAVLYSTLPSEHDSTDEKSMSVRIPPSHRAVST
jgi:hypothetical protein